MAPAFDAFTLEQDGLLTEILFDGYYQLNMSNPPRVTNVSTVEEALEKCSSRHFDMIIVMSRLGQGGHVELSKALQKARAPHPHLPAAQRQRGGGGHGPAAPGAAAPLRPDLRVERQPRDLHGHGQVHGGPRQRPERHRAWASPA